MRKPCPSSFVPVFFGLLFSSFICSGLFGLSFSPFICSGHVRMPDGTPLCACLKAFCSDGLQDHTAACPLASIAFAPFTANHPARIPTSAPASTSEG